MIVADAIFESMRHRELFFPTLQEQFMVRVGDFRDLRGAATGAIQRPAGFPGAGIRRIERAGGTERCP